MWQTRPSYRAKSSQSGFTLLEAIVAITLFATSGVAIYSLVSNNLRSLNRVEEVLTQQQVVKNLVEELQLSSLAKDSEGSIERAGLRVVWRATQVEPSTSSRSNSQTGSFMLTLYDIELMVYRGERLIDSYHTRQVNYQTTSNVTQ